VNGPRRPALWPGPQGAPYAPALDGWSAPVRTAGAALRSARGRRLLGAAALAGAAAYGAVLALNLSLGLALAAGAAFAVAVAFDLRLALVLWVPLAFLEGIPALNAAGKATGVLVAVGWLVWLARERRGLRFEGQAGVFVALALLEAWLTASLVWAVDAGTALSALLQWYAVGVVFLVVAMAPAMAGRAAVTLIGWAFVAGAVLSVLGGVAAPGGGIAEEGRYQGTLGDPNLLAAALFPAAVLALGLAAGLRDRGMRTLVLVAVLAVLGAGFVASGSRGGVVGALAALAVAIVFVERRRAALVGALALALAVLAASLWLAPGAWERSPSLSSGSGRGDLWTVAWHMAGDHPLLGVGLDNYPAVASDYARSVGPLKSVDLIDDPHEAHNLYLQLLAEAGVVGLAAFTFFVATCLYSAWVAARLFRSQGDRARAALAGALLVAIVAMLGAAVFVSAPVDRRLWVLLALGPALRVAAGRPWEGASDVSSASVGR
jgi:O-antigen ligase